MHYDVIVLGGGGAGLFCAATAGRRGRRVAVLEHNEHVGRKIAISGGGRCNFTNLGAAASNYLSERPEFCRSALARYTPGDFVALVERHGLAYHEKKLGQLFCDGSARGIIELLRAECANAGVEVRCGVRIESVEKPGQFRLGSAVGEWSCDALVVATGGLSFQKLGATDFGYRLARQFGLRVTPLRPALVPLTFSPADQVWGTLSGVALPVAARCGKAQFEEALLFTHRGISGPAVLQISSYWREGERLELDLLPAPSAVEAVHAARRQGRDLADVLGPWWPRRFAEMWCSREAPHKPLAQWRREEFEAVLHRLRAWPILPAGTEGYPKAEVTLGGVDTAELSSKTMEARRVPGLYFIGEVVDVTGWLGGYNFQWAWASGHAAGEVV